MKMGNLEYSQQINDGTKLLIEREVSKNIKYIDDVLKDIYDEDNEMGNNTLYTQNSDDERDRYLE